MAVYMVLSRRGAPKVCMNAACITAYQCPRCCHTFQLTSDRLLPAASHLFQQQRCSSGNASDGRDIRMNPLNIQMISKALHKQIFGEETPNVEDAIHLAQQHLESQGLWGKPGSILPNVDVQLPPLVGEDIDEHFRIIAEEQSKPYLELAIRLAESTIPAMPRRWRFEPGWTKYVGKEALRSTVQMMMPWCLTSRCVCLKASNRFLQWLFQTSAGIHGLARDWLPVKISTPVYNRGQY